MASAEHLRSHAAHLFAMALKAHENGDHDFAELLTARAMHYIMMRLRLTTSSNNRSNRRRKRATNRVAIRSPAGSANRP
jgi:hypothetical protein